MAKKTITITADISPELQAMLDRLSSLELTHESVDLFLNLVGSAAQIVRVDTDDRTTTGAGDLRVVLQPSEAFLDFMAAVAG